MDPSPPNDEGNLRGLMFSIAYRMTGGVTESEDVVQEAFFRLERARQSGVVVESPKAYLAAATTRLTIDHMRSARVRRECYVGTWLPEPIVADLHESPEEMADLSDSLSTAFLVMLESLSPVERAVFLLREVFDYNYDDIAQIVDKSEANCRQIFVRARKHIASHETRYKASAEQSEALVRSFLAAAQNGDFDQLVDTLAADAMACSDGGGKATALRRPLYGRERLAKFFLQLFARTAEFGRTFELVLVNGEPGLLSRDSEGKIASVQSFEILDGKISVVRGVTNPDKLQHLGPVSDVVRRRDDAG